ncbi:MAG: hypothetical protein ABFD91_17495 [Anaerohalosphaeraceae bacterium]
MKKTKIVLMIGLLLIISVVMIQLFDGLITPFGEIRQRKRYLEKWNQNVERYVNESGNIPESLFEVAIFNDELFSYTRFIISDDFEKNYDLLCNPNYFKEFVEYKLYVADQDWYIVELKPGKLYKRKMFIDRKGDIYCSREMKGGRHAL